MRGRLPANASGEPLARTCPAFMGVGDTQKQVSQFPVRHCERSEAIQGPQYDRLGCWRRACCGPWIASSQGLLAMTDGSALTRSCSYWAPPYPEISNQPSAAASRLPTADFRYRSFQKRKENV